MCGIVGYVGPQNAPSILLKGLEQLEYRGYDSAGITLTIGSRLVTHKQAGRVAELTAALAPHSLTAHCGIGHTRWATHGPATDTNAHPHTNHRHTIAVVHIVVIENHHQLRTFLATHDITCTSDTDTEVIAHLISHYTYQATDEPGELELLTAIRTAVQQLEGAYGLAITSTITPDTLIAIRRSSPLVLGIGTNEYYLASDTTPVSGHTQDVVFLNDDELAVITPQHYRITSLEGKRVNPIVTSLTTQAGDTSRGRHPHYMLKEIYEQPDTVTNTLRGRLDETQATARLDGLEVPDEQLQSTERLIFTACGTSYYAALVGEYLIEQLAKIPVEVEYASELRYRNAPLTKNTLLFCISQSGETADTLAALRNAKEQGVPTLGIVNAVGSSIAREAQGGLYLHAGPEIGVASTKAFTAQIVAFLLLALKLGRLHNTLSRNAAAQLIEELHALPQIIASTIEHSISAARGIAARLEHAHTVLYLGRGTNYPVALEGALKLKEVSYIHAEGYPAAELKHGPIALVDPHTPSVVINPPGPLHAKIMSNMAEIKARGGPVITITAPDDTAIDQIADYIIPVPTVAPYVQPLVTVLPLQLIAYYTALRRGCDVDKPRNLAKSVTVE